MCNLHASKLCSLVRFVSEVHDVRYNCGFAMMQFVWHLTSIKFEIDTSGTLTYDSLQDCLSYLEAVITFPENLSKSEELVVEESISHIASPYSFVTR